MSTIVFLKLLEVSFNPVNMLLFLKGLFKLFELELIGLLKLFELELKFELFWKEKKSDFSIGLNYNLGFNNTLFWN